MNKHYYSYHPYSERETVAISTLEYLTVIFAAFLLLWYFFKGILFNPNAYLFSYGGDGIKNYFTPAYYIKYGEGFLFKGMYYPHFEHVIFTDNQPFIAGVLRFIQTYFFSLDGYTIGIFNGLMILSIGLTVLLLYYIARYYTLPHWYALVVSILITALSPQIARLVGHYALSYTCYIPLLWFLLIKNEQSNDRRGGNKFFILLLLTITVFGFIHPYYLFIGVLFIGISYLCLFFLKSRNKKISYLLYALLIFIIPFLIFQLLMWATDSYASDRPDAPYGFYIYRAYWESIFLPTDTPLAAFINKAIKIRSADWEGRAYVGIIGFFVAVFTIYHLISRLWKRNRSSALGFLPDNFIPILAAATLVALFSLAIPFIWGLDFLLDLMPPVRQFRSLGRFAWVFYYVFSLYTAYALYAWYLHLIRRFVVIPVLILVLSLSVWGVEAHWHLGRHASAIKNKIAADFFGTNNPAVLLATQDTSFFSNYQAIIPLPYGIVGSEKLYIGDLHGGELKTAYFSGIPLINGFTSRTSIPMALQHTQVVSSPYIEKEISAQLLPDKDLLIVLNNEFKENLSENEKYLLQKSDSLFDGGGITYYTLSIKDFSDNDIDRVKRTFEAQSDSILQSHNNLLVNIPDSVEATFVWENFTANADGITALGSSYLSVKENSKELWKGVLTPLDSGLYEISCWFQVLDDGTCGMPELLYSEIKPDGTATEQKSVCAKSFADIYHNWVRCSFLVPPVSANNVAVVTTKGQNIVIASLLIHPQQAAVYAPLKSGTLMYNNFYLD